MRLRYCSFDDITVRSLDGFAERLGRGAAVDFDREIGKTVDGDPITMEEALGEYAAAFTETPPEARDAAPPAAPRVSVMSADPDEAFDHVRRDQE